ncbi:MAG: 3-hydroxybutyrate oligomer hydrolase family protein [Burkholderiales bacterium]
MTRSKITAAAVLFALAPVGYADNDGKPSFIKGPILLTTYDGVTDDLLTAGLGKTGLGKAPSAGPPVHPPTPVDSLNPTAAELRVLAIYNNYRALVDPTTGGGFGVLYGPNKPNDPNDPSDLGEGKIAGEEYLAFADDGSGEKNVTLMVQIPLNNEPPSLAKNFDPENPCIVTATSSGSRGVYGAIGTAGDWGLKQGCAVAYNDKGTGTGAHNLQTDTVNLITGVRTTADEADKDSNFTADLSDTERTAFNSATPNRFAFKHAHSEQNPEKDWDRNVLQSIRFAFFVLNQRFGEKDDDGELEHKKITRKNTIVIASSVSNGGGAALRAAEQDAHGLIDGVAVTEPNVNPTKGDFSIVQGSGAPFSDHSKSLYDYATLVNVFQPCASVALGAAAPLNLAPSPERCQSLREKGLLESDVLAEQAAEAQQIINDFGILPEQNIVQPSYTSFFVPQAISVTYANAYGRFSVVDNLCGYSFGATDATAGPTLGDPIPLAAAAEAALFGTSNGIPPTGGVNLINNLSVGGAKADRASISPSTKRADQNVDGALCLRALATGIDPATGQPLSGTDLDNHVKIEKGISRILASGDLHGIPTLIATGRADANLALNHTSRAYYGLNQLLEGEESKLRYYEVTNAHHLDTFNQFAGFNDKFVPLHFYFVQVMNLMFDHLKNGAPLPLSQVVRTMPRGIGAPQITLTNVPPIEQDPAEDALITFDGNVLTIPE